MRNYSARGALVICVAVALTLQQSTSIAAAAVIHDTGDVVPSVQYLSQLFSTSIDNPSVSPVGLSFVRFPIRTKDMFPGELSGNSKIRKSDWLTHPIFLVGSDPRSRLWLEQHASSLLLANAMGIVVDVENYDEFQELQKIANGVPLAPATADGLSQVIGVHVYPVLIQVNGSVAQ